LLLLFSSRSLSGVSKPEHHARLPVVPLSGEASLFSSRRSPPLKIELQFPPSLTTFFWIASSPSFARAGDTFYRLATMSDVSPCKIENFPAFPGTGFLSPFEFNFFGFLTFRLLFDHRQRHGFTLSRSDHFSIASPPSPPSFRDSP